MTKQPSSPQRTSPRSRTRSQSQEEPATRPTRSKPDARERWTSPRLRKKRSQSHDDTSPPSKESPRGRQRSKSDVSFFHGAAKTGIDEEKALQTTPVTKRRGRHKPESDSLPEPVSTKENLVELEEKLESPKLKQLSSDRKSTPGTSHDIANKSKPSQSSDEDEPKMDEEVTKESDCSADNDSANGGAEDNETEDAAIKEAIKNNGGDNIKKVAFHEDPNPPNSSHGKSDSSTTQSRTRKRGRRQARKKDASPSNELTSVIPGYTAALQLDSSSLNSQRPGLEALRRRALVTDKTTASFVKGTLANQRQTHGMLASKPAASASLFKAGPKRVAQNHAGSGWFGMVPTPMTDDVKRDLTVIRNRNYLDPKRFYKSSDRPSRFLQVGTVVEGTGEFFSSRLSKKQRRSNLTEEIMADPAAADYTKRKYKQIQQEKGAKSRAQQKWNKGRKKGKRAHL